MINLFPMAGSGNRFFQEKYNVPKPFIPILGKPMFISAIRSFPDADENIFIVLQEHVDKYQVNKIINTNIKNIPGTIIPVNKVTEGQACTCLLAKEKLDPEEGLFISSCDYQTIYDQDKYKQLLDNDSIDVIIWTFKTGNIKKAKPEAFAYCRTEGNKVLEVVEKKVISDTPHLDPAVVGSFTYRRSELFVNGAEQMINRNIRVNNEFYVGTSINQLIEQGYNVVTFEIEKFISFGNPFELMLFQYWQEYFDYINHDIDRFRY
ncbi:sugar phosphate nucleotidyltransferase [Candidatus Margulisiibacteriota bacterium]